jgi:hypothetical protein
MLLHKLHLMTHRLQKLLLRKSAATALQLEGLAAIHIRCCCLVALSSCAGLPSLVCTARLV